ncbi:SDR family oxidoreductase [bacterium]|nr:SDR family oxidoreductase [bacterium]
MDLGLTGKVVFITGGTGDIGNEIVKSFVLEGAKVAFTYNRADKKAEDLVKKLGSENCVAYKISVLDKEGLKKTAKEVFDRFGAIDILVNNAAIAQVLPLPLIEEEEWDELMDINVKGTFLVTKELVRFMIKKKQGTIINLGSLAGERIMEVPVHYATSKAAITGFTLSLAKELSRYNIRVNCVVPGLINGGVGQNTPDKQKAQYIEFCTLKRLGEPREVSDLILFLASSRASYINGQIIHVDGGI